MKSFAYRGHGWTIGGVYSEEDQQYELVGITSYRDACVTDGLFTRIAPFIDWILTVLNTPPPTPPPPPTIPPTVSTTTPPDSLGQWSNFQELIQIDVISI